MDTLAAIYPTGALRLVRGLWCFAAAILALHAGAALLGLPPGEDSWVTGRWTPAVAFAACAACCLARAAARSRDWPAWAALGVGLASYAAGQVWFLLFDVDDGGDLLVGSTVLWLAMYPCAIAAVALLVRAQGVPVRHDLWLDGVTAGLTIAAAGLLVLFELVIDPVDAFQAAPANLVYALGDLVVVGFGIAGCAVLGWRPPAALVALIAGFCAQGMEDVLYLHHVLNGFYPPSLDTAWIASVLAISAAAAWTPAAVGGGQALGPRSLAAFPLVSAVVAVVLAMYEATVNDSNPLAVTLTGLALVAVAVRCAFLFLAYVATIEDKERIEAHLSEAQCLAGIGSWEWEVSDGRMTWSAEMSRLHGWPEGARPPATREEFLSLLDPEGYAQYLADFNAALAAGESFVMEYRLRHARHILRIEGQVARDADGRLARVFGTAQDVTERVARLEAERANQAKNEFLSRMSHELRTPLNAVLGFGQLLEASELTERQRGNVGHILGAGRHLVDLVDEVLDLARIEGGQLALALEPVEVRAVVRETTDLIAPLAHGRRVTVHAPRDAAPVWVRADEQRLKQVLLNLLSNAVKYNREDGRVEVRVVVQDGQVRVDVSDTGVGIAPEDVPRLFLPFERLGAERSDIEGTGLGLPLTIGLVEAMGGTLDVRSLPGAGSTFSVDLAVAAPSTAPPVARPPLEPLPPAIPSRRVLCIEDNVSNLTLMHEVFAARPGLRLDTAVQGRMGIDLAREHRPDLILLDLDLPDVPGAEVLRRLRGDDATAGIPVVIVSADATPRQIDELLSAGARDYLTKPIDIHRLLRVVDDALGAVSVG